MRFACEMQDCDASVELPLNFCLGESILAGCSALALRITPQLDVGLWPLRNLRLQLSQILHYVRLRPIHGPNKLAPHDALAVDDVSLGELERSIERIAFLVAITH